MASDRARVTFDPARKWRGLIAQQGRVSLEADWNEASEISADYDRLVILDFLGPIGTPSWPSAGYGVTAIPSSGGPAGATPGDFVIGAGALYVGGERVDLDDPVRYSAQAQWLDSSTDALWVPTGVPPAQGEAGAFELVYLLATEHEVGAVEDPALADVALGGPDTMQRRRLVQRFVRQSIASAPTTAAGSWWDELSAAAPSGAFAGIVPDYTTMRVRSDTTLRVSFSATGGPSSSGTAGGAGAGYLGAENQMIRVRVVGVDAHGNPTLVWAYDDASFLYRVEGTYDTASGTTALTFANAPVDAFHQPAAGQAVELLRDAAALDGADYIAATTGSVTTVVTPYNATTMTMTVAGEPPADYLPATTDAGPRGPQVAGITPAVGVLAGGTQIHVSGTGFTGASAVDFGPGNVGTGLLVQSDTELTVISPGGQAGTVDVTVTTPLGTSPTGSGDQFAYAQPGTPQTTAVAPSSGVLAGGTVVTVTGNGFTGATQVTFGATPALGLVLQSDTQLTVTTPPGSAGPVAVTVVTPQGPSPAGAEFTYSADPPPQVTGVAPATGPLTGGTVVTVGGTGFTGASEVDFGTGNPGTGLSVVSDTELTVVTPAAPPPGASTAVAVTVTTPAGPSPATAAARFQYELEVTGVIPRHGPPSGGTTVRLTGSGFTGATGVFFGGVAATEVAVLGDGEMTAVSPPGIGPVDVTVSTPAGSSVVSGGDRFTYEATPQLFLRLWQAMAARLDSGQIVVGSPASASFALTGTGVTVTLASATGQFHAGDFWRFAVRPNDPTAVLPARYLTGGQPPDGPRIWICPLAVLAWAGGRATVTSTVPQFWNLATLTGQVLSHVALPAPAITGVSPSGGDVAGGTPVTVTGTGFLGASVVNFGNSPGTNLVIHSDTQLTVVSPSGTGAVDVSVLAPQGTSPQVGADRFTYLGVTGVSPAVGPTGGNTAVTVSGTGFTGATGVTFGGVAGANMAIVSDSEITVTSPPGTGLVDITVVTPHGTTAPSASDQFAYADVGSMAPASGPEAGGTTVTVLGVGFTAAAVNGILFGSTQGQALQVVNDGQLSVNTPFGTGAVPVILLTRLGQVATGQTFTYIGKAFQKDIADSKNARDKSIQDKNQTLESKNLHDFKVLGRENKLVSDRFQQRGFALAAPVRSAASGAAPEAAGEISSGAVGASQTGTKRAEVKPPETPQRPGALPSTGETGASGQSFITPAERPAVGTDAAADEPGGTA